ncbi:MAG: multidrug resistance efflux pump [Clostridiaceae bacterium]|nr:multidrug resistance efflux pump [Clostridiaceae bacterium]
MKRFSILFFSLSLILILNGCSKVSKEKNTYTGTIECESFYITSDISGKVLSISAVQGASLKKDDKIADIDTSMYKFQKQQAEGALLSANAKYDSIPEGSDDNIKKQAQGAVIQAKAAVDIANLQISKGIITNSKEGTVTDVFVHEGELVQPGTNILKVMDTENKYVKIYLEETNRDKVKLNDSLNIYYNDKSIGQGKITYISPQSEFTPKNTQTKDEKENTVFEVKVKLSGDSKLSPGTLVDVEIK